jgi:peptidoglycan hydrolase-like amidase
MENEDDTPTPYYVAYNGKCAVTYYCASVAGKTASATSVWGGKASAYLSGGVTSAEKVDQRTVTISADEMYKLIMAYDSSIVLSDNPAEWIRIVSHDSAYGSNIGYINEVMVGNKPMRGNAFRDKVMNYKIRSHCFTLEYIK